MKIILDFSDIEELGLDHKNVVPEALRRMADNYVKTIESGDEGESLDIRGAGNTDLGVGDWYIEPA